MLGGDIDHIKNVSSDVQNNTLSALFNNTTALVSCGVSGRFLWAGRQVVLCG